MVQWDAELSVRQQCELLELARSGLYYEPVATSAEDIALMRIIDETYTRWPFYGSRRMVLELRALGHDVNRKRVQRLMREMGLEGLAPGPSTSRPAPEHAKYPYLLRNLEISRPNHVWAVDITYIPMRHGYAYLVALLDWWSRMVLAWRLSNTMDVTFCVEALEEAVRQWGVPELHNSDQGAQFTAEAYLAVLRAHGVQISMDGVGRCKDNIFVERLWRSVKYEEVYLHAYDDVAEARAGLGRYFSFYNTRRPHQALGGRTPREAYLTARGSPTSARRTPQGHPQVGPQVAGLPPAPPLGSRPAKQTSHIQLANL
jgi:putative transposase